MGHPWRSWIQEHVDPVDVFGAYTRLRRSGRRWVGLCPMHPERTPSFYVFPETGTCYCFGCRRGGDVLRFLQIVENMDFPGVVRLLQERWQLPPPPWEPEREVDRRLLQLVRVLEMAHAFYQTMLLQEEGATARAYLTQRGLPPSTWEMFGIGYAPSDGRALLHHLLGQGIPEWTIPQCGLFTERGGEWIDLLRHRIVFPIHDYAGRVVAFAGRALDDASPKYLNSPETPLFRKSRILFGLGWAATSIRERQAAVLVEGYLDALMMAAHGWPHTVAVMGTALTPDHLQWLGRHVQRVWVCFDADEAGIRAAWDALRALWSVELTSSFVVLPANRDPADVLQRDGRAFMEARFAEALEWHQFVLVGLLTQFGGLPLEEAHRVVRDAAPALLTEVATLMQSRRVLHVLLDLLAAIPNETMRYFATLQMARCLYIDPPSQLHQDLKRWMRRTQRGVGEALQVAEVASLPAYEKWVLLGVVQDPGLFEGLLGRFGEAVIEAAQSRRILRFLYDAWYEGRSVDWKVLTEMFPEPPESVWIHDLMRSDIQWDAATFRDAVQLLHSRYCRQLRRQMLQQRSRMGLDLYREVFRLTQELMAMEIAYGFHDLPRG